MNETKWEKVAIVTGASKGIGRAICVELAKYGYYIVVNYRSDEQGAVKTLDMVKHEGADGNIIQFDVSNDRETGHALDGIINSFESVDVLVNNAGISGASGVPVEEIALESWRGTMSVNLDGVFLGVKHGVAAMTEGGGSIINTSSILGFVGLPFTSAYSASKGGARLLSKAVAMECAARGLKIRVNSVHPGFIDTPMVGGAIQKGGPERREAILSSQPTGEMGRPEDIAEGVLYLAADAAKFVTGSELVIDGGYLAR